MSIRNIMQDKIGLLDKFDIKVDDISDYMIVAVDPGAGEWSGAKVEMLGNEMDTVKDLYVLSDIRTCKDFSVLYYGKRSKEWLIGESAGLAAENEEAERGFYENFKVLPGSPAAMECYGRYYENPTMEELMVRNFQGIIKRVLVDIDNGLSGKKLIIFVGRPASKGWEEAELAYRNRLYQALEEIEEVKKEDILIAMVSEAQASLAAEIYGKGLDLKSGNCQVVIDVGSSTVDVVVVKDGRVIGEYSRQMGAGLIEGNMLDLFLYDDCDPVGTGMNHLGKFFSQDSKYQQIVSARKKLREKLRVNTYIKANSSDEFQFSRVRKFYMALGGSAALIRFGLRTGKEAFFGKEGKGGTSGNAKRIEINGVTDYLPIDNKTMEKAIYQMPVFVPSTEQTDKENPYKGSYIYRSYYDALSHFMEGVKEMFLAEEAAPDVILTGGASVMPFVSQLVRGKFGVEPANSNQPSYTVSRGLAYIGYAEIKKQEELLAINGIIENEIEKNKMSLSYDVKKAFSNWYVNALMADFENWKMYDSKMSLKDAINKTRYYSSKEIGEMELVREWWTSNVKPEIVKQIKNRFEKLYKNADVQYDFVINPQIVENAYREGETTTIQYSWSDLLGFFSGLLLDPAKQDYPREQREKFYKKADDRRESLGAKIRCQQAVINLAEKHTGEILDGFMEELYKDVITYVEGLTPYIVRQ